ncbi:MAG: hypothetical protein FIA97_03635 [Methylococcaceae bacterium]|nr:hypothetical protein [Methylococcaceae bacterium]
MRIVIVVGDGTNPEFTTSDKETMPLEEQNQKMPQRISQQNVQAMEFWNSGVELAQKLQDHKPVILVPVRVNEYNNTDKDAKTLNGEQHKLSAPEGCEVTPFNSSRQVANYLQDHTAYYKLVIVIGHGSYSVDIGNSRTGGYVELCRGASAEQRNLSSSDFDVIQNTVYMGLHCHAQWFTQDLPENTPGFHLTGQDVGSNADISTFVTKCKNLLKTLASDLSALDLANEENWVQRRDQAQVTLNNLKNCAQKKILYSGIDHELPKEKPRRETAQQPTTTRNSGLPPPPIRSGDLGENKKVDSQHQRRSVPRVSQATIRGGYRIGIATWNAHGLSKRIDEVTGASDTEDGPMAVITNDDLRKILWLIQARDVLKAAIEKFKPEQPAPKAPPVRKRKDQRTGTGPRRKPVVGKPETLAEQLERSLSGWTTPYVQKQIESYESFAGPVLSQATDSIDEPNSREDLEKRANEVDAKFTQIDLKKVEPRLLTRKLACLAITELFSRHHWLDILVLQEVKFSGIELLIDQLKDHELSVYAGPLMKSSGDWEGGEREYYPLIMRSDMKSRNNPGDRLLQVKRIWWLDAQGVPQELAVDRVIPNVCPKAEWGTKPQPTKKRKGPPPPAREGWLLPKPDLVWDKHQAQATFRPVVNYDIAWKEKENLMFHVGVVHTTPSEGGEFERKYEFDQIQGMVDEVAKRAFSLTEETKAFAGPWLLPGDYYLFKESRVTGEYADDAVESEFERRLSDYDANAGNIKLWINKCRDWMKKWNMRGALKDASRKKRPTVGKPRNLPKELLKDARFLARQSVTGTALARSRIRMESDCWLYEPQHYDKLGNDQIRELIEGRIKLYTHLWEFCGFCQSRATYLRSKSKEDSTTVNKWAALKQDNTEYLRFRLSDAKKKQEAEGKKQRKTGKTALDIKISTTVDPSRASFGQRFIDDVNKNEGIEVTQSISGSNTHLFRGLPLVEAPAEVNDAAYNAYLQERAFYAAHLKVADFIVHTRFDPKVSGSDGHWRAWCLGLLCPDVGKVVLADSEDLAVSRFWACFSDHFPVGGLFSTGSTIDCNADREEQYLYKRIVRTAEDGDCSCVIPNVKRAETERIQRKFKDLKALAMLLEKYKAEAVSDKPSIETVCKLEQELLHKDDVPENVLTTGLLDYGWDGRLDFLRLDEFARRETEQQQGRVSNELVDNDIDSLRTRANELFEKAETMGKKTDKFEAAEDIPDIQRLKHLIRRLEELTEDDDSSENGKREEDSEDMAIS